MEISVIIPVYNAEKYVAKAVESAIQFMEVKEVLLVEDGSPDNALEICKQLEQKYPCVKLLQHPDKKNHGAGASRNLGLMKATCPYIAFLDADDFYLPNRFEADNKIFSENPDCEGVYNALGINYYSDDAKIFYKNENKKELTTVTKRVSSRELFESLIYMSMSKGHGGMSKKYGYFSIDCLTIKKEALNKLNYWFNPNLKLHQDTEFLIRLIYTANLCAGNITNPTAIRGVHAENRSTNINLDQDKKNLHQKKLWDSLHTWAEAAAIPEQYRQQIYRIQVIKNLPTYNHIKRLIFFFISVFKDKRLVLDPVYYEKIHYIVFGKSIMANFLYQAINKSQNLLLKKVKF